MEVAIARLPLRFSFQYLPYLVFPPGANVHPNRYFSPTGTCNLSLPWPGTLSISASSQLEVLQYNFLEYEKGRLFAMVERSF